MQQNLFFFLSLLILGGLSQLILPWWALWPAALIPALLIKDLKAGTTLSLAFLAGLLLWGVPAWWINEANEGILAGKMGILFGGMNPLAILCTTMLVAGLTTLLGSWTGLSARRFFR